MLGWELPPFNSGGLGVACLGLTEALASKGVDIDFVLPLFPKKHAPKWMRVHSLLGEISPEEAVRILSELGFSSPYHTADEFARLIANEPERLLYGKSIFELTQLYTALAPYLARKLKFDVIHAHDWLTFDAAQKIHDESGKPFVAHIHATEFDRTGSIGDARISDVEYRALNKANMVLPVSEYTGDVITQLYGIPRNHISVVHNGVPPIELKKLQSILLQKKMGSPLVLFVGRLTMQKGAEYFLKAAKRVLEHKPDALFIISGSGDSQEALMHEAADLGIIDKVFFVGFMRGDDLSRLYANADIYVMPSVSEPFGITALEAAQHGATVILSKQSGAREVLKSALECDFWDTDEMAHLILSALSSKGLRATIGEGAKKDAKEATWGKAAEKVIEVYRKVVNK